MESESLESMHIKKNPFEELTIAASFDDLNGYGVLSGESETLKALLLAVYDFQLNLLEAPAKPDGEESEWDDATYDKYERESQKHRRKTKDLVGKKAEIKKSFDQSTVTEDVEVPSRTEPGKIRLMRINFSFSDNTKLSKIQISKGGAASTNEPGLFSDFLTKVADYLVQTTNTDQ